MIACQKIFDRLDTEIKKAKNGLTVATAEDFYLDFHGVDYRIPRHTGETDESYRFRIQSEMLRQRNTLSSIISALRSQSQGQAIVYEPWKNLFVVGKSKLSGTDKIINYEYWDYHVIDVLTHVKPDFIERTLLKLLSAGKTLYITHIVDGVRSDEDLRQFPFDLSYEFGSLVQLVSEDRFIELNIAWLFDVQAIATRYLGWSPCMEAFTSYPWEDNIEVPYLQMGWRIKVEVRGVDY